MRILALESSCDESAVAVYDDAAGLLSHEIYSQIDLHRVYGGVVPELASRDHVRRLLPLLRTALADAKTTPAQIDGVAYTAGPGLIGALLTGAALGRSLAYAWNVPAIAVHHLEGHLLAPLLEDDPPPFPHLALLVSGGHTMLIDVARAGPLRGARRNARRRGRRSLRQVRQVVRPAVPRRARARKARCFRQCATLRISAADARSCGSRIQLFGVEDRGFAGGQGMRTQRTRSIRPRARTSPPACRRPSSRR